MDGPRDYHTKRRKSEKDKYHMIVTYMWSLKSDANQHIYKTKKAHRYREQTYGCQGWWMGVWD